MEEETLRELRDTKKRLEKDNIFLESEIRTLNFKIEELNKIIECKDKDLEFYKQILLNLSLKKEL